MARYHAEWYGQGMAGTRNTYLKTSDPPKMIEWYFHASSTVTLICVKTIAHGSTQRRLEPSAWYRNQRGVVARRMAESW